MHGKVVVLNKDGQWFELENCFLVGAVEHPDKVLYYKFLFSKCDRAILDEMLKRAESFLEEQKLGASQT